MPVLNRYPGEGDTAFEAFARYITSGWDASGTEARRFARISLEPLQRCYGVSNVLAWFDQFDWELRAAAYDAQVSTLVGNATREQALHAKGAIMAFANSIASIAGIELERTLIDMRRKGRVMDAADLVNMIEKVSKVVNSLAPPSPEDGQTYQPDMSDSPDDALIHETALAIALPPPPNPSTFINSERPQ